MYTEPQTNGILVWWQEIPSHQQMGCITKYSIYLQKKDSNVDPVVYGRYLVRSHVMCKCCLLRGGGW